MARGTVDAGESGEVEVEVNLNSPAPGSDHQSDHQPPSPAAHRDRDRDRARVYIAGTDISEFVSVGAGLMGMFGRTAEELAEEFGAIEELSTVLVREFNTVLTLIREHVGGYRSTYHELLPCDGPVVPPWWDPEVGPLGQMRKIYPYEHVEIELELDLVPEPVDQPFLVPEPVEQPFLSSVYEARIHVPRHAEIVIHVEVIEEISAQETFDIADGIARYISGRGFPVVEVIQPRDNECAVGTNVAYFASTDPEWLVMARGEREEMAPQPYVDPEDIPDVTDADRRQWREAARTTASPTYEPVSAVTIDELLGKIDEALAPYDEDGNKK